MTYAQYSVMLVIRKLSWDSASHGWRLTAMSMGDFEWIVSYKTRLLLPVHSR